MREVENVRFSEAIFLRGSMVTNIKAGYFHCELTEEAGGIVIDLPATKDAPHFITKVPFSKVRQVEYKAL